MYVYIYIYIYTYCFIKIRGNLRMSINTKGICLTKRSF